MADNDRSLSNRNRSGLSNERGIPHNSLSLDAFYQKAKKTANRFVVGLKEYFDFLVHGDAEIQGDVSVGGDTTITGDLDVTGEITGNYLMDNDTKANLDSAAATYPLGQRVLENDTSSTKTGDNSTTYPNLPYDYGYQKLTSGSISTTGWYTIAIIDDTEESGSGVISVHDDNGNSLTCRVSFKNNTSAKTHQNTGIEILTPAIDEIDSFRIAKSDSVKAGAKIQVYLDPAAATVYKSFLSGNAYGDSKGIELVTYALEASPTLPDGVTSGTFLEAGEEYNFNPSSVSGYLICTGHRISNDVCRFTLPWGQIPKNGGSLSFDDMTNLFIRGGGTTQTLDGTYTVDQTYRSYETRTLSFRISKTNAFSGVPTNYCMYLTCNSSGKATIS